MFVLLPPSAVVTVKKAGGALCYTVEGTLTTADSANLVFKDSAGANAGTGTYNLTTMTGTVSCGGNSYNAAAVTSCLGVLSLPTVPGVSPPGATACTAGTCAP